MGIPPLNPALFHLDPEHLWIQHCAEGPVPRAVVRGIRALLHRELWPWDMRWQEDFLGIPAALKQEAAALIGGQAADINLCPSTSAGLVTLAQTFPWRSGDEVVAPLGEFPSNAWPWKALQNRGVTFREVPLWEGHKSGAHAWDSAPPTVQDDPEARLLEALSGNTRILTVSWVRFQDGLKLDLKRLGEGCRAKGVHLVVDGIQGAGTTVPDLSCASAFATGGHKGLLGPQGQGFLWTSPEFRAQLAPTGTWLSVEEGTNFSRPSTDFERSWVEDGRKLEPGSPSLLACTGLLEALRTIRMAGVEAIGAHVHGLQGHLLDALAHGPWAPEAQRLGSLLEPGRLSSILSLHHGALGLEVLQARLEAGQRRGIYASVREGYLRIAFHGWHDPADVDRVAAWLRE